MKKITKKLLALAAALCVLLAAALPAIAGGGLGELYYGLTPGYYDMTSLRFDIPYAEYGGVGNGYLSGVDVANDGSVTLNQDGTKYNFVWEQTYNPGDWNPLGVNMNLMAGYYNISGKFYEQLPIDGHTLFGFQKESADMSVRITYSDVFMEGPFDDLTMYDEYNAYGPTVILNGKISIQITTTIDGTYTIPEFKPQVTDDFELENELELREYLTKQQDKIHSGSTDGITWFDEPQLITFRIDLDGRLVGFGGDQELISLIIGSSVIGEHDYTTIFRNQTYTTPIRDSKTTGGDVDFATFSINCPLSIRALTWSLDYLGPLEEFPGMGGDDSNANTGGYGDPAGELREMYPDYQDVTADPAKVAVIAAGTGVAALGVSIIVSLIGDATASAAASAVASVVSGTVSSAASTAASATASDAASSVLSGFDSDSGETLDSAPPDTSSSDDALTESKKQFSELTAEEQTSSAEERTDEIQENTEETETPELPEEDSPEVSMSLFAPDKDLLNVKGGAASITVQIEGGEGYVWNYIPAIISPGTVKAIIPTVTGRSNLATLNLGMTGTKLESRHYEVFVNLIAWTTTPDGKVLKTTASMEMNLHEPGIEAKKNADGSVTVTACVETTLKGFADIRKLSPEEYTCTTLDDGTLEITAIDPKLGKTTI